MRVDISLHKILLVRKNNLIDQTRINSSRELDSPRSGVQASPVTEKPELASIAGHLNFWGVKTPETVDAVGVQPTASILSAKVGGLEGIRIIKDIFSSSYCSKICANLQTFTTFIPLIFLLLSPVTSYSQRIRGIFRGSTGVETSIQNNRKEPDHAKQHHPHGPSVR